MTDPMPTFAVAPTPGPGHPGVHPPGHFQKHVLDPCCAVARRRPGETAEQLQLRLQAIGEGLSAKYGRPPGGVRVDVEPDEVHVDPERHRTAVGYVAWASKRLGIPAPELKWFDHTLPMGTAYYAAFVWGTDVTGTVQRPPVILLADDLRGALLCEAALEECVHASREARGLSQDEESARRETYRLLAVHAAEALKAQAAALLAEGSP